MSTKYLIVFFLLIVGLPFYTTKQLKTQSTFRQIEGYMAIPGQALGYKNGQLKILELREKYMNDWTKNSK